MGRTFVTGASGFIGGALATRLHERGDDLVGLARSDTSAQKVAARGLKEARRGTIFAAYLKLAPVFIFLFPGMIAVALWKQGAPGFENIGTNPQSAFPVLVSNLLPIGLLNVAVTAIIVAAIG